MDAKPKKKSGRRRGKKKSKIADRWNPTAKEVVKTKIDDVHGNLDFKPKEKGPMKKEMSMMQKSLMEGKGNIVNTSKSKLSQLPETPEKPAADVGKLAEEKLHVQSSPSPPPSSAGRKVGKLKIEENKKDEEPPPAAKPPPAKPQDHPSPEKEEEPDREDEEVFDMGEQKAPAAAPEPAPEPIDEEEFFSEQEEILVDDNRTIPDAVQGMDYLDDVYVDQSWLKEASRVPPDELNAWLEPYVRAKYIIFEFADFGGENAKVYSSILGKYALRTFQTEGLYFYHVATGLSNSSSFIRHCREFIAMNHKTLRELIFNTVGSCHHFFIRMPLLPALEMVAFSIVDLDENVFKMLSKQPRLKHLCIAGGHENDFQNEEFLIKFFRSVGKGLITLGLEDPHITSTPDFWTQLLPLLPKLRVLAVKHWVGDNLDGSGGGKCFTDHISQSKYGSRLTRGRTAEDLDEDDSIPDNYKWWEYTSDWKIRVLEEAR